MSLWQKNMSLWQKKCLFGRSLLFCQTNVSLVDIFLVKRDISFYQKEKRDISLADMQSCELQCTRGPTPRCLPPTHQQQKSPAYNKRALHIHKRALYIHIESHISTKELYMTAKETYGATVHTRSESSMPPFNSLMASPLSSACARSASVYMCT